MKNVVSYRLRPLHVISEIFGSGRPARFHSALSVQHAERVLQAALIATSSASNSVSLVGEVIGDRVRIGCTIRGDGVVKRNYTCFSGRITKFGEGCELIGSFIVPIHGKLLMAMLILSASIFAVSDFADSFTAQSGPASWLRGPATLLGALIAIPYFFGLDRQQISEISTRIGLLLNADSGQIVRGSTL